MPKIKFENGVVVNVEDNPTQADIEEIASQIGVKKAETPPGVSGAFKRGWTGLKEDLNKRVDNTGKAMNTDQSVASKALQVAGQGFGSIGDVIGAGIGTAASAVTPDAIEQPIKNKFTEGVQKIMQTETAKGAMEKYGKFKEENPELVGNIEAVGNIADAFLNAVGVGAGAKGAKIAGKEALKAGEKAVVGAGETIAQGAGKVAEKTAQGISKIGGGGDIAKSGASWMTGLEKSTIDQITQNPDRFTKEAMKGVDRESVFNKVKTAVDKRLEQLSETGKEYGSIRESGEKVMFTADKESPVKKVLAKYGIDIGDDGKLITTAESAPLGSGDVKAIQKFINQYMKPDNQGNIILSSNAFMNARKALSNMSKFAEDKTDMAGTIARGLRKELDNAGKSTLSGLSDLDKKFASEIKLLEKAKKAIYDRSGNVKSNAMSVIANLTGQGKEQILPIIEKIVPGISKDVDVLKAIMDIEKTKGVKVGTYMRGATGGFLASGGNPIATILSAIATSPQVAVPAIREFSKSKPQIEKSLKSMLDKLGKKK
ncbi:MAG: hypothetical protein EOM23_01125 [Candidatus Moranbacteria bacterium]|nr:hypothetical protein [Candidatus Moranbacteria bacterium]